MVLLLPVVLSFLGLSTSRGLRVLASLTLLGFAVISAIGLCYIPSGLLLVAAAYRTAATDRGNGRANTIIEPAKKRGVDL